MVCSLWGQLVIVLSVVHSMRGALLANRQEFLASCSWVELTLPVDALKMEAEVLLGNFAISG